MVRFHVSHSISRPQKRLPANSLIFTSPRDWHRFKTRTFKSIVKKLFVRDDRIIIFKLPFQIHVREITDFISMMILVFNDLIAHTCRNNQKFHTVSFFESKTKRHSRKGLYYHNLR